MTAKRWSYSLNIQICQREQYCDHSLKFTVTIFLNYLPASFQNGIHFSPNITPIEVAWLTKYNDSLVLNVFENYRWLGWEFILTYQYPNIWIIYVWRVISSVGKSYNFIRYTAKRRTDFCCFFNPTPVIFCFDSIHHHKGATEIFTLHNITAVFASVILNGDHICAIWSDRYNWIKKTCCAKLGLICIRMMSQTVTKRMVLNNSVCL